MLKFPEDTARFHWTRHIKNKMVFYNLSGNYLLRIFRTPERREEGIAPNTIAAMKTKKSSSVTTKGPKETEVWVMYAVSSNKRETINSKRRAESKLNSYFPSKAGSLKSKVVMISAWRYPGKTKPGERPPIPEGLLEELTQEGLI